MQTNKRTDRVLLLFQDMNFEVHFLLYNNSLYNFNFSMAILIISFCRYLPVAVRGI